MPPEVKKALDDTEDILNRFNSPIKVNNCHPWTLKLPLRVGKISTIFNNGRYFSFVGSNGHSYFIDCNSSLFFPTKTCFKLADDLLLLAKYYEDKR